MSQGLRFTHTRRLLVATITFACAVMLLGVVPKTAAHANDQARIAFVLDASSSMREADGNGTRLDTAKKVAIDTVNDLPEDIEAGMLVYGSKIPDSKPPAEACQDIATLAPVGKVDKAALTEKIQGIEAKGYTPIGNSLLKASDELGASGKRSIILVSDGLDTCAPPDACEVAKQLAEDGVDVAIEVVGFKVNEEARTQLSCIAEATGGSYLDAADAKALSDALRELTKRAVQGYRVAGTAFELAGTPEEAKYLGAGQYQTTMSVRQKSGDPVDKPYFRVAAPKGYTTHISATAVFDNAAELDRRVSDVIVALEPENESSYECNALAEGSPAAFGKFFGSGFATPEPDYYSIRGTDTGDCDMDQWVISLSGYQSELREDRIHLPEVPVEVLVQFEPNLKASELEALPPGDSGEMKGELEPLPIEDPQPVSGGSGFNDAETVGEGSFSASIVPGEYRFFRVPVEWGQNPMVTVSTGPSVRKEAESLSATMYSPFRVENADTSVTFFDQVSNASMKLDRDVHYLNRDVDWGGKAASSAGDYYIGVSLPQPDPNGVRGQDQPFEFTVKMLGTKEKGPKWEPVLEPGPKPSDTPIGPEGSDTASDGQNAAQSQRSEEGSNPWPFIVTGGTLLLIVAGALTLFFVLRKRRG